MSGLRAAVGVCLLVCVGCGGAPDSVGERPMAVVARISTTAAAPGEVPAVIPQPEFGSRLEDPGLLTLGTQTREALRVDRAFRIFAPPAEQLVFSTALAGESATGPVVFRVERETSEGWQLLFEQTREPGVAHWDDQSLRLEGAGADPLQLRFSVETEGEGGDPVWGSILLLGASAVAPTGPNIILVSLDTLGAEFLGAARNDPEINPFLDTLFERSHVFRRAYSPYGSTFVSHSSLFSGQQPLHHRRYLLAPRGSLRSLVVQLARHGYVTSAITEDAYVGSAFGFARGFDWFDDGAERPADAVLGDAPGTFAAALEWLEEFGRSRFFLFVHTYEVHSPYVPREPESIAIANRLTPGDERLFDGRTMNLALMAENVTPFLGPQMLRRYEALYIAEIHDLDEQLRTFFAALEARGLLENTLVVLTSDHGDQFGEEGKVEHGETLHPRVMHVPLAFFWPGEIAPGTSDSPVQLVDVMPTLLDLAGIEPPEHVDGRSLVPALRGQTLSTQPAFSELHQTTLECQDWPEPPCDLGRYAVFTEHFDYESSAVPLYEHLYVRDGAGERVDVAGSQPAELERHRALLRDYLGGQEPAGVLELGTQPEIDDLTRDRLRGLGYLE